MNKLKVLLLPLIAIFSVIAVGEPTPKAWNSKMRELSSALSDAIPYLYQDQPVDSKILGEKIKRLYEITKQLDGNLSHGVKLPDSDPALPYIADMLRNDIERAYQSVQEGHTEYAKGVVRSSVAYCIACHTRIQRGVEFPLLKAFSGPLQRASWIEKIEFQAASRQFDPMWIDIMVQIDKPGTTTISAMDIERAARIALSIAVRVKKDPDKAMVLAKAVGKSPSATSSMKESAKTWEKDIVDWKKEKDKKYESDKDLIMAARNLNNSEVKNLRASMLMHDLLSRFPKSEFTAEALYIIGMSYASLRELGLWSLHEMYFQACVQKLPHSQLAERCYKEYSDSVVAGYTGSSGTHMPKAVRKHLDTVKQLAKMNKAP